MGLWLLLMVAFALVALGVLLWMTMKSGAHLPGDIVVDRGNTRFIFPLLASAVVSIVLTVALNVIIRLAR